MPRKVSILLILLALLTLARFVQAAGSGATADWIAVVINIAFMFGIIRGSEGARALLRGFAAIGLIFSAIGILMIAASGLAMTGLGVTGLLAGVYSVVVCAFMYWCLGQEDVIAWITSRRVGAEG